jgi:hypothetical protein
VIVSPAQRTLQTANALTDDYETIRDLAPGAEPAEVLRAAGWPAQKGAVLVVAHQPTLGLVASLLMCGKADALEHQKRSGMVDFAPDAPRRITDGAAGCNVPGSCRLKAFIATDRGRNQAPSRNRSVGLQGGASKTSRRLVTSLE